MSCVLVEGSGRGFKELFKHLPEGTEENTWKTLVRKVGLYTEVRTRDLCIKVVVM